MEYDMNAVTQYEAKSLQMADEDLMPILQQSIWPGSSPGSAKMALDYCRAAGLDPLQKPVHIMQVSVKNGDRFEKRDVVFPGIGVYRVQASRTGTYAGMDEPVFGPMASLEYRRKVTTWADGKKTERYEDAVLVYPEWCKVTIYRVVSGQRCPWSATVWWLETYATAGRSTTAPNEMWEKRVRGQIAKCAEAQALRMAFPEIGALPTAEEMEGRYVDTEPVDDRPMMPKRKEPERITAEVVDEPEAKPEPKQEQKPASAPAGSADVVSTGQELFLKKKAGDRWDDLLKKHGATSGAVTLAQWNAIKADL